ncbi:terminase large subunit domain-containing protein [Sphingobium yanoikuyae]|uniref:terminase large subunit domain-containing protein n=1 Tax=Sphingobium yanoikuyae TaxID=13690 RepID=UPI0035C758B0
MLMDSIRDIASWAGLEGLTVEEIVGRLSDDQIDWLLEMQEAEAWDERYRKFDFLFPDETRHVGNATFHARHFYKKHMEFFRLGAKVRARCFMAANRVGKTFSAGGYEMSCHLTGRYPHWWEGRRFRHPIRAWACGKTNETTRDIVQTTLLGDIEYQGNRKMVDGAGVIPRDCIGLHSGSVTWKQGVADLIDTIKIKHISGGWSKLGLKSYQQGRGAFEGTAQHVIWDDEEPPMDVYNEQVIRTATTKGIMMLTFTPLEGMSDVVQQFLPDDEEVIG